LSIWFGLRLGLATTSRAGKTPASDTGACWHKRSSTSCEPHPSEWLAGSIDRAFLLRHARAFFILGGADALARAPAVALLPHPQLQLSIPTRFPARASPPPTASATQTQPHRSPSASPPRCTGRCRPYRSTPGGGIRRAPPPPGKSPPAASWRELRRTAPGRRSGAT